MKKLFFFTVLLSIIIFKNNYSSYLYHRNNGLQVYINPLENKEQHLKINVLKSLLKQAESKKYKNMLSILIFTATLDALSLEKLDEFKQLLEKKFLKEKTVNYKIDLLIAESLYEEKLKKKYHIDVSQNNIPSFYNDTQKLLTDLNNLKKHSPLSYIYFESKLMKVVEERNVPTNVKCFTALTNFFSPVTIKIV